MDNMNYLVNRPEPHTDIQIVYSKDTSLPPFFSVVIPVHNQEDIIVRNVKSILNNMTDKYYEIIHVIDSCSDTTAQELLGFFTSLEFPPLLTRVLILKSDIPLFETACDNLGFVHSTGEYCLEIQADMEIIDYGFCMKLLQPFLLRSDIIGVSGRCCHNFNGNHGVGKMGLDVCKTLDQIGIDKNCFYLYETCNRGPLLLDRRKLKELGYLDEVNYFLDNSDHDLFARAAVQKQWLCGYVPVEVNSPLENGSTRKPRDELNQYYYDKKKRVCREENGFLYKHGREIRQNSLMMGTNVMKKINLLHEL